MIRDGEAPDWICIFSTSTILVIVNSGSLKGEYDTRRRAARTEIEEQTGVQ